MSIVQTEVESIHGDITTERMFFFRCQDHLLNWHSYGPVRVPAGETYTPADHFTTIAARVAQQLATNEYRDLVEL